MSCQRGWPSICTPLAFFWTIFLRWGVYNPLSTVAPPRSWQRSWQMSRQFSADDVIMLPATRGRQLAPTSPDDQHQTYLHRFVKRGSGSGPTTNNQAG
eukprot:9465547-Pyramimonas_sp.AAC.1